MRLKSNHCVVAIVLSLTACASVYEQQAEEDHSKMQERTSQANNQLRMQQNKQNSVVMDTVPRFTRQSIPFQSTQLLPAHIGKVTLRMPGRQNLLTIASLIERLTSIPVTMAPDALLPNSEFSPTTDIPIAVAPQNTNDKLKEPKSEKAKTQIVIDSVQKAGGPKQFKTAEDNEPGLEVNYQGGLAGLLDLVAMHNDLQWIYANGKIHFFRVVTRTMQVKTLPSNISDNTGAGGAPSGGEDVMAGIEKTLKGMLSKRGKLQVDASMGTVTVTDSFTNVQSMERHLDSVNRQLSRQVALTVEVLQVSLNSENQSGIDWNFVTSTSNLGTLNFAGPPALTKNSGTIGLVKQNSDGSENSILIRALEKFGRVSSSYSSVITTMNRQAVPLGSTNTQSYLKQITPAVTTASNGSTVIGSPGLIAGEIETGFTMMLLPIVLDSNHVLMNCGIKISSLKELSVFSSGTGNMLQSIQQPNVSSFKTIQKMMVKSGDTIVLSGFENETTDTRESDFVRKTIPGTKDNTRVKTTLVVLITPRLVN